MPPIRKVEYESGFEVTIVGKKDQVSRVSSLKTRSGCLLMHIQDCKSLIEDRIKEAKSAMDKATFNRAKTHLVSAHKLAVCTGPDREWSL